MAHHVCYLAEIPGKEFNRLLAPETQVDAANFDAIVAAHGASPGTIQGLYRIAYALNSKDLAR